MHFCVLTSLVGALLSLTSPLQATLVSSLFAYDDPARAKNLRLSFQGEAWNVKSVSAEDIPFYQTLFSHPDVMAAFGNGSPRPFEDTEALLRHDWIPRFQKGHPNGSLTFFHPQTEERAGYIIAGGSLTPGVSEIASALMPLYWHQKRSRTGLADLVHIWAPEVRRIGLGIGLDEQQDGAIIEAFRCFQKCPLERLEATASPSNEASWRTLDHHQFQPSRVQGDAADIVLDFDGQEFPTPQLFEEKILTSCAQASLLPGRPHRLIDPNGHVRTFSKHVLYERIKYHFELGVDVQ